MVFGFPLFMALALRDVDAVHAAVVTGVLPLGTAVVGALVLRQRASRRLLGLRRGAAAPLVLAFAALAGRRRGSAAADGRCCWRVASASIGYVRRRPRLSAALPAEHVICWVLVLLAAADAAGWRWRRWPAEATAIRAASWLGFGYVTLFSMWLGFFAWYRGLALGGTCA